ncbi:MAG: hypothetical protein EBU49_08050 [Proteobacteria bacterium]|nr:hypothetical protein [Pseudomonadota bacterium]
MQMMKFSSHAIRIVRLWIPVAGAVSIITASVGHGATTEIQGTVARQTTRGQDRDDFQALRMGATFSEGAYGFWGFVEGLHDDHGDQATYGELAGVRSFGHWSLSGAGAGGTDPRLRPSNMVVADLARRIPELATSIYAGYTRSAYDSSVQSSDSSVYRFYRVGAVVAFPPDWNLNVSVQRIQREILGNSGGRRGSAGGLSLTRSSGDHRIGASLAASCLALTVFCRGGSLERYAEFFMDGRIALAPQYGLIGRMGFINQSSGAIAPSTEGLTELASIQKPATRRTQIWLGGYRKL